MGLFRAGEKRYQDVGYTKELKVSLIGWKRILKNTKSFGWGYVDEEDDGTIPPPDKVGKFKVSLLFLRIDKLRDSLPAAVRTLEFFYNIIFLLRRMAAFLLPLFTVAGFVLSIIKKQEGFEVAIAFVLTDFAIWIAGIILESILARCADSKLKGKPSRVQPKNQPIDIDDDDDDVVTLTTAKGEELDFVEIAGIAYRGNFYAIMQPVELLEGMGEDDALVFKVSRNKDGKDNFEVELDDKIIDAVFAEYNKLLDEAEEAEKKRK